MLRPETSCGNLAAAWTGMAHNLPWETMGNVVSGATSTGVACYWGPNRTQT